MLNPVTLPTIRRLDRYQAETFEARFLHSRWPSVPLSDKVIGTYRLPRGSVFASDDNWRDVGMVAFSARVSLPGGDSPTGNAYVVVGHDPGDIEWPVWLHGQRKSATGDIFPIVADVFGDVIAQLRRPLAPYQYLSAA